jgi:hypothetical protein
LGAVGFISRNSSRGGFAESIYRRFTNARKPLVDPAAVDGRTASREA